MKKALFLLIVLFLSCMGTASAYDFSATCSTGQTLYYSYVSGSTGSAVYVTDPGSGGYSSNYWPSWPSGCSEPTGSLSIPSSVSYGGRTYSVIFIVDGAFSGCSGLTSVTIPNSVTTIYDGAFYNCSGLTNVSIPNSVTSIRTYAFYGCSGLTNVTIPSSVTSIGNYAFAFCHSLAYVTIPNSVTSIGYGAFWYCNGLTNVTIPNSVTSIGEDAFWHVRNIVYSGSATGSPWGALSVNGFVDGYFVYSDNTKTHLLGCSSAATGSVTIPNSVTSIGNYAFDYCRGLTNVTIPSSVTSIGNYAFRSCSGLTSVTIPNSVTSIGNYAFRSCSGLTSVTIPNSVTSIDDYAFYECSGLTNVTIPNSVTSIGNHAFDGCSSLTNVTIPNSVTTIGDNAFQECSSLTNVTIPNSVTSIGEAAFLDCSWLTNITIGNSVTSIGNHAFLGCSSLTNVTIPNSVTSIGNYAFSGCRGLTNVTIGNSVTSIGDGAFEYCRGLTNVTIPNSVTSIGSSAFYYCSGLTNVTIGNSVTSIGYEAFAYCSGLTSVTIGNSVTSIGAYAFANCSGLTNVTIGNSVTSIGDETFHGCSGLTNVTIPNSVTSIGYQAFYLCSGLDSIICQRCVPPTLGNYAFAYVPSTIPVMVPCGSQSSYASASKWSSFSNIQEGMVFSFSATSASAAEGSVAVLSAPTCPDVAATVSATPNEGYRFDHWNDGNTDNPRTLTVTQDTAIVAYFAILPGTVVIHDTIVVRDTLLVHDTVTLRDTVVVRDTTRYSLSAIPDDPTLGWTIGSGRYAPGESIEIYAVATTAGNPFLGWSDGIADNPRRVAIAGNTSITAIFTPAPLCPAITEFPYTDNFDSYTTSTTAKTGVEPTCWELVHQYVSMTDEYKPMIYYSSANAHSGRYSLLINKRGIYAMPEVGVEVSALRLSMYLKQSMAKYQLVVGVMTDKDDASTFVPIQTINNGTTNSQYVMVDFSCYAGNGRYIAFKNTLAPGNSGDFSCNYIDDLVLDLIPVEPEPECGIRIADLPYSDNFDSHTSSTTAKTGVEPACWELVHQYVTMADEYKPMLYYSNAHSGNYSLLINKRGIYAMPEFEGSVNTLRLSMYLRQSASKNRLVVGVMSDKDDINTFVPVQTIDNSTTGFEQVTVDFSGHTGNGHFIAFKNTLAPGNSGDFSCNYIDDLVLDITTADPCMIRNSDLPYFDNFDSYTASTAAKTGVEPDCWELVHQYVSMTDEYKPMIYNYPANAHSGNYSLLINKRGIYAMPEVEASVSSLLMTMYVKQSYAKHRLVVGVMTDKDDISTFVPVQTIDNSTTSSQLVTVDFSGYTGSGHYIAFKNTLAPGNSGDFSCNYIDDLTLYMRPASKSAGAEEEADAEASSDAAIPIEPETADEYLPAGEAGDINVYPNPTTGRVNVEGTGIRKIEVYDNSGRQMAEYNTADNIDFASFAPGIYNMRITYEDGVAVKKVVKK